MNKLAIVAAGLACIVLSGCGDNGAGREAGGSTAATGGMPANWKATDACSIIDKAEMAEVMKSEVTETSLALVHEPDAAAAGTSECTYLLADGGRAAVMTRWSPIDDNTPEAI